VRAETHSKRVVIDIMVETWVEQDGKITAQTITTSHGNAKHTMLGRLDKWERGWYIAEVGPDGAEFANLFADTKAQAIKHFTDRAVSQAAKWAAA
jgi:hypothetical protein